MQCRANADLMLSKSQPSVVARVFTSTTADVMHTARQLVEDKLFLVNAACGAGAMF